MILGVDIGVTGALALLTPQGDLLDVADMPALDDGPKGRSTVNAPLLAALLQRWRPSEAFVEYVAARPGDGSVGAFGFGRCKGVVEGVCGALGLPVSFLTPPAWKRLVGIPAGREGAKDRARAEAIRRWPDRAEFFARIRDADRAEAALIAAAGLIRRDGKR
jgi:crossover junction endodeoxyribonuclease RuvC